VTAKWYEVAFDRLYPVLYEHRDAAEAEGVVSGFGQRLTGRGAVLDLACGNGRYMDVLGRAGVEMVGVDLSAFLLREAWREPGLRGRLVQGDMRRVPIASGTLGGVINMFTSFGYFEDDADNRAVLEEVARVLRPGGVFLFDYINRGTVTGGRPMEASTREAGGYRLEEHRSLVDDGRFVVKHVVAESLSDGSRVEYDERLRLYRRSELEEMLTGSGMNVTEVYGNYERAPFDEGSSPRLIMVCEKGTE